MRRCKDMMLVAGVALVALLGAGTGVATAATQCGTSEGARWCNAPSTDFPQVRGWYGYVGTGGGPCNSNPRGTTFPAGFSGICVMPAPEAVWRWTGSAWTQAKLDVGVRGYVHPFADGWRWIHVDGTWYAIAANRLTLEWRA